MYDLNCYLVPLVPAKAETQYFGQELDSRFRGNERRVIHQSRIMR